MAQSKARTSPRFRVLVGCSYPPREHEWNPPGAVVDDFPPYLVSSWIEQGIVEPYADDPDEAA